MAIARSTRRSPTCHDPGGARACSVRRCVVSPARDHSAGVAGASKRPPGLWRLCVCASVGTRSDTVAACRAHGNGTGAMGEGRRQQRTLTLKSGPIVCRSACRSAMKGEERTPSLCFPRRCNPSGGCDCCPWAQTCARSVETRHAIAGPLQGRIPCRPKAPLVAWCAFVG